MNSKEFFHKNGYLIIKDLYDPKELYHPVPNERGIFNYFGSINKFSYSPEEIQVLGSVARYSHPQYKQIHSQIRIKLEDIIKEDLYNTYYYDRYYFADQELKKHIDRPSCEISVSVQVSRNGTKPWPFYIETPDGKEVKCVLENGWGLLYKGCERPHWRYKLPSRYNKVQKTYHKLLRKEDDTYHHQIFFHYVRANGQFAHHAFDMVM